MTDGGLIRPVTQVWSGLNATARLPEFPKFVRVTLIIPPRCHFYHRDCCSGGPPLDSYDQTAHVDRSKRDAVPLPLVHVPACLPGGHARLGLDIRFKSE